MNFHKITSNPYQKHRSRNWNFLMKTIHWTSDWANCPVTSDSSLTTFVTSKPQLIPSVNSSSWFHNFLSSYKMTNNLTWLYTNTPMWLKCCCNTVELCCQNTWLLMTRPLLSKKRNQTESFSPAHLSKCCSTLLTSQWLANDWAKIITH